LRHPHAMSFLFGSKNKQRTPSELVRKATDALQALRRAEGPPQATVTEHARKYVALVKAALYGTDEAPVSEEYGRALLAEACASGGLLELLVTALPRMDLEVRKEAGASFARFMRIGAEGGEGVTGLGPAGEYVKQRPSLALELIKGYESDESPSLALTSGPMLRECIRHEVVARTVLESPDFDKLFVYVALPNFEVASDAFITFKDLLTLHKSLAAEVLDRKYDGFVPAFNNLLTCDNYALRRQALKLLADLLLERMNAPVMMRYVADVRNLVLMMQLLRDSSRTIQFEAFHVFKVFVANPNKPEPVVQILVANRDKLVNYLAQFQADREDEEFLSEKSLISRILGEL